MELVRFQVRVLTAQESLDLPGVKCRTRMDLEILASHIVEFEELF